MEGQMDGRKDRYGQTYIPPSSAGDKKSIYLCGASFVKLLVNSADTTSYCHKGLCHLDY